MHTHTKRHFKPTKAKRMGKEMIVNEVCKKKKRKERIKKAAG